MAAEVVTMDNTVLTLIQVGSMVSTFAFILSRGLRTSAEDLQILASRPGLLLRSLLSIDILVPLITLLIINLVRPAQNVTVGMLLLAASPAAAMALKKIVHAGGESQYIVILHVVLALLAILTTPATLEFLQIATGRQLGVNIMAVAVLVGLTTLLPIITGMIISRAFPAIAARTLRPLEILSDVVQILTVVVILASTYNLLLLLDLRSYLAIALVTMIALAVGHLMAWGRPEEQTTLAIESATRNTNLTLLIASAFVPLEKALPVIIPYIVTSAIICALYVRYRKSMTPA